MMLSVYRCCPVNQVQQRPMIKSIDLNPAPTFSVRRLHANVDTMMRSSPQLQSQNRRVRAAAEIRPCFISLPFLLTRHLHRPQPLVKRGVLSEFGMAKSSKLTAPFTSIIGLFLAWAMFPLSLLLLVMPANGQEGVEVRGGFKFGPGGYYPPPHEKQLKSLLTGARAQPQPGGIYLITDAKFETFLEDGRREMLVEAPQCLYDARGDESVHSEGPLSVKTADGKFSIAGDGFRWQTNSSLFISNRVHTIVHPELLQPQAPNARTNKPAPDDKGMEIFSEQFDYAGDNGLGNYRRNVRMKGTELDMSSANLQFLLQMKTRQLQRLDDEENVIVNSGEVQAK